MPGTVDDLPRCGTSVQRLPPYGAEFRASGAPIHQKPDTQTNM